MADDYDIQQHLDLVSSWSGDPMSFLSHYFTLHYHWDQQDDSDRARAIYVRQAPNKVCIVGITDTHPALQHEDLQVIPKLTSGANVKPDTVLCELVAGDATYTVRAHMRGKLLEHNRRLATSSTLLRDKPTTEGYLAVILPFHEDPAVQLKEFVSPDQYHQKAVDDVL